jgi:hypothetical protein
VMGGTSRSESTNRSSASVEWEVFLHLYRLQ